MNQKILIIVFILLFLLKKDNHHSNFYQNIQIISNASSVNVLVNKNYQLPKSFIPNNLIKLPLDVSLKNQYLKKEAATSFINLSKDAKKDGYTILAASTYRGYQYQEKLYNYYVQTKGLEYADLCSARPGHSEHQTGLSLDVMGSNYDYNLFIYTKEYDWMQKNAHKYGFILRYPKGKEYITGFKFEPWHYRYVGKHLAEIIKKENITLEEYFKK